MRRLSVLIGLACGLALLLYVYRPVLFFGEQFGFRDSAHFYYPLYERVQKEWNAGRWPLWAQEASAGTPLLGNPTAAVLYPGKLVFFLLPHPWAVRVFTPTLGFSPSTRCSVPTSSETSFSMALP